MSVTRVAVLALMATIAMTVNGQASVIQGSVLDVQGKPVRADVVAYRLAVMHGDIVPRPACFTSVDNGGRFQCGHIEQGAYILLFSLHQPAPKPVLKQISSSPSQAVALKTSYADLASTPRIGNVPLVAVYPALSDWQLSNLLHVGADDTQFVSVAVDNDVDGTLEAAPASGIATGQVQLLAVGEGFAIPINMQARVDPKDGDYLWQGLPAGGYRLEEDWGSGTIPANAQRSVTLGTASTLTTSLAGPQGYALRGSIAANAGLHIPSGIVLINSAVNPPERFTATVTTDGGFQFSNLPGGVYSVAFPLSSKTSVSALQINGNTTNDDSLDVNGSLLNSRVLIGAEPGKGSIAGSVRLDGSEREPGIVIQSVLTGTGIAIPVGSNGFFRVSALPVGQYFVTCWSDLSRVPYNSPAFLAHYRSDAASVTVNEDPSGELINVSCNNSSL